MIVFVWSYNSFCCCYKPPPPHTQKQKQNNKHFRYNAQANDIDKFAAANPDILVVVAAGNEGFNGAQTIASLGYAKNAIVVGAHQSALDGFRATFPKSVGTPLEKWFTDYRATNGPSVLASFSSRGPTADGRIKPDVVATVRTKKIIFMSNVRVSEDTEFKGCLLLLRRVKAC